MAFCDTKSVFGENFESEKEAKFSGLGGRFAAAKQTGRKQVQELLSLAFDQAIVLGIDKKNLSRMIGNIKSKKTQVDFWTLEEFL